MAMLQKKRTMRQINQTEGSMTNLEASQAAPVPLAVTASCSGSNESLLPETNSSGAVSQLNIPPAYAAPSEMPTAEPAAAAVVPAAAAGSGPSLSPPQSPQRSSSPPPTLQESQISQISQLDMCVNASVNCQQLTSAVLGLLHYPRDDSPRRSSRLPQATELSSAAPISAGRRPRYTWRPLLTIIANSSTMLSARRGTATGISSDSWISIVPIQ